MNMSDMQGKYWVKYKGRVQGPFTLSQLKAGLSRGKLSRSHSVSMNRRTWNALGDTLAEIEAARAAAEAEIAIEAPSGPISQGISQPSGASPTDTDQMPQVAATQLSPSPTMTVAQMAANTLRSEAGVFMAYLLAGGIAVVLWQMLPIMIANVPDFDGSEMVVKSKPIWLWGLVDEMPGFAVLVFVLIALTGIAMIVVSVTTRGLARAIPIVAAWSLIYLIVVGSFDADETVAITVPGAVILLATVVLWAAVKWRASSVTAPRRVIACVAGSLLALASLILLIQFAVDIGQSDAPFKKLDGTFNTIFLALSILLTLGLSFAITAGIMGILLVRPPASETVSFLCAAFVRISMAILFSCIAFSMAVLPMALLPVSAGGSQSVFSIILATVQYGLIPLMVLYSLGYATYELMLSCTAAMSGGNKRTKAQQAQPPQEVVAPFTQEHSP
jgi:hypothetical protein